jgi:hypothetical protein
MFVPVAAGTVAGAAGRAVPWPTSRLTSTAAKSRRSGRDDGARVDVLAVPREFTGA